MKKRLLAILLAIAALTSTACTGGETADTSTSADTTAAATEATTDEATTESEYLYVRPEYTDLSADGFKIDKQNASFSQKTSTGTGTSGKVLLDFGVGDNFTVSDFNINHDSAKCDKCGVVEKNGKKAFYFCVNSAQYAGITVTLNTPVPASCLTQMNITYMSDKKLLGSVVRVMVAGGNDLGVYANSCPALDDGAEDYATADLNVTDISELADLDGYLRSFKIYFRDKDGSGLYLQNISLVADPAKNSDALKNFVSVGAISGNTYYGGGALDAVAQEIADRFSAMDIAAEINVRRERYTSNSTVSDGKLAYKVVLQIDGKSYVVPSLETVVPKIKNTRLEISDGAYGAQRESLDQWKNTFDCGGIVTLTDNTLTAPEGIVAVEYAVIASDAAYDAVDKWYAPQRLELSDTGIKYLYVNAALDYGDSLVEGESYRFVIRGVTRNKNYVIHLDIPFEYCPMSAEAMGDMSAAVQKLSSFEVSLTDDVIDREGAISQKAEAALADENIRVDVRTVAYGVGCTVVDLYVSFAGDISSERMSAYPDGDTERKDFYAYTGEAYKVEDIYVSCTDKTSSISLTSPADGQYDVNIASDAIIQHMNTPSSVLGSASYYFANAELCSPPPVMLEWSDENASEGKKYTVTLSEYADLSKPFAVLETESTSVDVYNLKGGTRYYWQVSGGDVNSLRSSFVTSSAYPRFIKTEGMSNFRDLGGYVTMDGKTIKQGLLYRSAWLDPASPADKIMIKEQLGVITDLDLRGESVVSPLGAEINFLSYSVRHYHYALDEKVTYPRMRQAIAAFANEENYPMIFHCYIGRDRTGTVAALIYGILGVDVEIIKQEYMLSLNSTAGHDDNTAHTHLYELLCGFIDQLDEMYGKATYNENAEAFLLDIGVTPEEIQSIRRILLED